MSRKTTAYAVLASIAMLVFVACTAAVKAAKTVLDIGDAACEIIEENYDNATAKVACDYIDQADSKAHLLTMVIPAGQARAFKKSKTVKYVGTASSSAAPAASASK